MIPVNNKDMFFFFPWKKGKVAARSVIYRE